jgi:hypothetical protein
MKAGVGAGDDERAIGGSVGALAASARRERGEGEDAKEVADMRSPA